MSWSFDGVLFREDLTNLLQQVLHQMTNMTKIWPRIHGQSYECIVYHIHSSSKETQLFWTPFSRWPWVTDPDFGSCTFYQMVLLGVQLQLHFEYSLRNKVYTFFWSRVYLHDCWGRIHSICIIIMLNIRCTHEVCTQTYSWGASAPLS